MGTVIITDVMKIGVACPVELLKPCLNRFLFFANRQLKNSPNRKIELGFQGLFQKMEEKQ